MPCGMGMEVNQGLNNKGAMQATNSRKAGAAGGKRRAAQPSETEPSQAVQIGIALLNMHPAQPK